MALLVAPRMKTFLFDAVGSLTQFDLKKEISRTWLQWEIDSFRGRLVLRMT